MTLLPSELERARTSLVSSVCSTAMSMFSPMTHFIVQGRAAVSEDDRLSEEEVIAQMMYSPVQFAVLARVALMTAAASIRGFLVAATDTTSSALSRVLHLLSLHLDVQDKFRKELKEAFEDIEELTYDQLVSLPFLEAVCRESLRL